MICRYSLLCLTVIRYYDYCHTIIIPWYDGSWCKPVSLMQEKMKIAHKSPHPSTCKPYALHCRGCWVSTATYQTRITYSTTARAWGAKLELLDVVLHRRMGSEVKRHKEEQDTSQQNLFAWHCHVCCHLSQWQKIVISEAKHFLCLCWCQLCQEAFCASDGPTVTIISFHFMFIW